MMANFEELLLEILKDDEEEEDEDDMALGNVKWRNTPKAVHNLLWILRYCLSYIFSFYRRR